MIPATHHNANRSAMTEDFVPRNSSAVATDAAGSIGTSAFRWLIGYLKTLYVGSVADNISITSNTSDCIIKVGGTERARIPLTIGLLPPGIVVPYSGITSPQEWLMCDGSQVSRTTYARLYTAIANTYGSGNGSTTFHLPDLRGRFVRGSDNMGSGAAGVDPDAAGRTAMNSGGNTAANVGSIQDDEYQSHTHVVDVGLWIAGSTGNKFGAGSGSGTGTNGIESTATSGGGNETRPKNANLNYIIKT